MKQILEVLSTLARAANFNFFPRNPFPPGGVVAKSPIATATCTAAANKSQFWDIVVKLDQSKSGTTTHGLTHSKSCKSALLQTPPPQSSKSTALATATNSGAAYTQQLGDQLQLNEFDADLDLTVENSPLARLMLMLDSPVLKHSPHLMDKMLTCLAYASAGIPQLDTAAAIIKSTTANLSARLTTNIATATTTTSATTDESQSSTAVAAATPPLQAPNLDNIELSEPVLGCQIELVVSVLKSKQCTQDGLQQAYTLLNNLSKINASTRTMIIMHLLKGTRELGMAVCAEIETLIEEAVKYNGQQNLSSVSAAATTITGQQPTTSSAAAAGADENMMDALPATLPSGRLISAQQTLIDSYSNLVISSPKQKTARGELQLPSMSILVEKNSNQKFFVRLIRLIINLREAIEKENKKKRNIQTAIEQQQQQQQQAASSASESSAAQPATSTDSALPLPPPLVRLSLELDLDPLWNRLSDCLNILKSLSDPYAVLILQQTVEAFFYVHATRKDKEDMRRRDKETKETQLSHLDTDAAPMSPAAAATSAQAPQQARVIHYDQQQTAANALEQQQNEINAILNSINSSETTSPDTKRFLECALTHRTVLNHILRQTSNNLSEEPYSVLVEFTRMHTHILDFDVKRRYFRQELDKLKDNIRGDDLAVHVRRSHVFDDSFRELNRRTPDEWKHRFYIVFEGEEGQDAGGLLREWYMIISKEIFNPGYALFMINPGDRVTYMPNPSSHCNPNHLSYFKVKKIIILFFWQRYLFARGRSQSQLIALHRSNLY